tara:strand:+ start:401 stop:1234 length:834 start_codon:yes stop_codon:yes gene_type:complete
MFISKESKPQEKLKAWYLFTEDFVAGTQHLTNEQIGVYIRLLCWNWNKRCKGIPLDPNSHYRIANCITEQEKISCNEVIKQFFVEVQDHYQNERQLQEYLFITKRIEASKINGRLGGRPKKPSQNPPTLTHTLTNKPKTKKKDNFPLFWKDISNKVSKGIAEKNFKSLDAEWQNKPVELAEMYNKYYHSVEDKKFAKQPAYWLSAKKYEDQEAEKNETVEVYPLRLKIFKQAIKDKESSSFVTSFANQHFPDLQRAIKEGEISKEDAVKYLNIGNRL